MAAKAGLRIAARVVAAVVGAYAVTAGAAALIAVALVAAASLSRSDAMILGSMIAYLLFALAMLWCFAERRLGRVWLVLLAGTLIMHGTAILVERTLPVAGGSS